MRFSPPYSAYARIYDRIGQRAFGERMAAVILAELTSLSIAPRTALDLGCGTGSATFAFARAGLRVIGLDRSPEMLNQARAMSETSNLDVRFVEGDMIDLPPLGRFDLVTCIYDAVNYLESDLELRRFVEVVRGVLNAGGAFVFDMNTRHRLASSWEQGLVLASDAPDLYVTYRSWFDEALDASPLIVTAFIRESEHCWIRFDEEHIERSWPIASVSSLLRDAGFRIRLMAGYLDPTGDLIRPARENHGRVLFIATQ